MKLNRIMLAAPKSGSGKTTITCALLQTLKDMGENVVSYKCGPDYIDPMFHRKVIDIPSKNLDTFFTDEETTIDLLISGRNENDFAVMEGVMGLFDGLGGTREEGSSYHLAKVTNTPIILIVDAKGMGRSVIPLIAGFLSYDREHLIKGVILNRMSKSYYDIIKPLIEEELKITVAGYFPDYKKLGIHSFESRHLGLVMPDEIAGIKDQLRAAAEKFRKTVSIDAIIDIAKEAEKLHQNSKIKPLKPLTDKEGQKPIIAIAYDEVFCFYYEDNLRLLREYGAEIVYFSPLHDRNLPEGSSGILLGGGYPELHADKLSANKEMLYDIRTAIQGGMPVVAECGGFMYLHSKLIDQEQREYPMAGVIDAVCHYAGKLVRFGYINLSENKSNFLPKHEIIKAHEFHYYDSSLNGEDCKAVKPVTGRSYPCVISGSSYWMGFPHLYYPSNPKFAESFVRKAFEFQSMKEKLPVTGFMNLI